MLNIDTEKIELSIQNEERYPSYYTGGYSKGEYTFNFRIINADEPIIDDHKYIPLIKVCKNIIMRGRPSNLSEYLKERFGNIVGGPNYRVYIDKDEPDWYSQIKGGPSLNPAADFFYKIIPEYLNSFAFIKQLILPEVLINDIVKEPDKDFFGQQVDFYLPQAKLVIEIDGKQHENKIQMLKDQHRDEFLKKSGIESIRIKTVDIDNKSNELDRKIKLIVQRLKEFENNLVEYERCYSSDIYDKEESKRYLTLNAIIRLQVCILHLLERGILILSQEEWRLAINNHEVSDYEHYAIEDLFIWIKQLCILRGLTFKAPKVIITSGFLEGYTSSIKIDNSLLKRWTKSLYEQDIIYIRSDYFDDKNYFKVAISDPIKYGISNTSKEQREVLNFFLRNIFGFVQFKLGQIGAIINSLVGDDTIGLLPTGGGKSLVYQLVALLQPGITYVVVPIVALMEDQIENLKSFHIANVNCINSSQSSDEKAEIQRNFEKGQYQIILISPERFQVQNFREKLSAINQNLTFSLAVIDEVHCLSEWGHDFRTSYLNLKRAIAKYSPSARILGLTATASINVLKDIKAEFDIENENIKTLPDFTRRELKFHIIRDKGYTQNEKYKNLIDVLGPEIRGDLKKEDGTHVNTGIIFTRFVNGQKGCYQLAENLSKQLKKEVQYFSGSRPNKDKFQSEDEFNRYKSLVQKRFKRSEFPLLVATKAFGMGIDKDNIRFTIHYVIPPSLESLYQEAGRAGRDGNTANCYIIFSDEDKGKKDLDEIFKITTSVKRIKEINEKVNWDGRDVFSNMFLWLKDLKGFAEQKHDVMAILSNYAKPGDEAEIHGLEIGLNKQDLEKAIYRLSILGIIEDWTIEQWGETDSVIKVYFNDYSEDTPSECLFKYIHKYDVEFDINQPNRNFNYQLYYNDDKLTKFERALSVLLIWQYENIINFRKESIKTVYDQCIKEQSIEEFKAYMENYFRFDDMTFSFDFIAENPLQYREWFKIFYNKTGKIVKEDIKNSIPALRRYLESYVNNTGLNFVTGVSHLIVDEHDNLDAIERLKAAFSVVTSRFNEEERQEIFDMTLNLGQNMTIACKNVLSNTLLTFFVGREKDVYKTLRDDFSLSLFINQVISQIKSTKEKIKWQI